MTATKTPPSSTSQVDFDRINAMFKANTELMANLASRWMDEREYENIDDYKKVLQARMPNDFVIVTMTSRPFGFRFSLGTGAIYSMVALCRKGGFQIQWKRVV